MERNKQRAISILLVLGSVLVLMATWNLSENRQSHEVTSRDQ